MGWFDEQIKQRMLNDDEVFAESFQKMADIVMEKSALASTMNDHAKQTKTAIDEILRYYHIKPQELPDHIKDMSEQLEYQLRPHGIMHRTITLRDKWYKDGIGILLASTADGDIVTLLPKGSRGYRYFDKTTGKYVKLNKKNEQLISREAMCFYNPLPLKEIHMKELLRYLAKIPSTGDRVVLFTVSLFVTLLGLLTPKINNLIFSHVTMSENTTVLVAAMLLLASVTISTTLFTAIKSLIMGRIQTKMDIAVQSSAMMRILTLPSDFFKNYTAGDIGNRMNAIGTLCKLLTDAFLSVGLTSLMSIIYIGQIFQYARALVVPAVSIVLLTMIFSVITAIVQTRIGRKTMKLQTKSHGLVYSMFSGVTKIKLSGAEKRFFAKWSDTYTKAAKLQYAPPAIIKYHTAIAAAIPVFGAIILYSQAVKSGVSVANYMAFNASYAMISGAFAALSSVALTAANIKPILEIAEPIMNTKPEIADNKKNIDRISGGIELNHVSFRYSDSMPMVIDDLSLKIRPGQYVAIVGGTGCGKSTLMRLMLGFESPQKGAIYYDGKDVSSINLRSLRQKIGVVMQNAKLFQGDIFSNIVISAPRLTLDDAWKAAEMAGIAEDIRNMPMGMNTMISEGAGGVSGGQRQRLMIARAIAPKPKILMFDEATSALDNITQRVVSDSLDSLRCTRIVIAHRLSTIRHCDRIIVLDKGKIIEDGTYDELMEQRGFFSELVARQQIDSQNT